MLCPLCKVNETDPLYQAGGVYVCESCWVERSKAPSMPERASRLPTSTVNVAAFAAYPV